MAYGPNAAHCLLFVNTLLLEQPYSKFVYTLSRFVCVQQRELRICDRYYTIQPVKPEIFTLYSFTE